MDQDQQQAPEMYRTNDMAMATFLRMQSHPVQKCEWPVDHHSCLWFFYPTEGLLDLADQFSEGMAQVEPREYNRQFGLTKREFQQAARSRNTAASTR